jgi:hypothetical protein
VDAHLLVNGDQYAVLINNEGEAPVEISVHIPAADGVTSATELFSNTALNVSQSGGARFTLQLPAEDGAIVMLS